MAQLPSSSSSSSSPPSSSSTPGHKHRPSISNPMHWLSRTTSNSNNVSKATLRHVDHKPIRSIEVLSPQRKGVLGAGATVVRTPDEALRDSSVRLTYTDANNHHSSSTEDLSPYKPQMDQFKPSHQRLPSSDSLRGRLQERQHALRQQHQRLARDSVEELEQTRPESDASHMDPISRISEQPQLELDDESIHSELPSPPYSPPLPALPISEPTSIVATPESSTSSPQMPPRPSPRTMSQHLSPAARLKTAPQPISISNSTSSYSSDEVMDPPPLPAAFVPSSTPSIYVPPLSPPSNFRAILLSEVPTSAIDSSKIIITLETSSSSCRTTLDTLCSRPSHLASYLNDLLARNASDKDADRSSMYSVQSDDVSTYQHHLTGLGLLPQSSFSMHLFLDRPSAPYSHILHYLRSPVGTAEHLETLPHPLRLPATVSHHSSIISRIDALLEVRDEAHFLDLPDLVDLCSAELTRYALLPSRSTHTRSVTPRKSHTRDKNGSSSSASLLEANPHRSRAGSIHSMHASVHSLPGSLVESKGLATPTLTPQIPTKVPKEVRPSSPPKVEHTVTAAAAMPAPKSLRSPPTPQSWLGSQRSRSQSSGGSPRVLPATPPAGWI